MTTTQRLRFATILIGFTSLVPGCTGPEPARAPEPPSKPVAQAAPARLPGDGLTLEERRSMFRTLVEDIRRYHIFSPATWERQGRRWEDGLAELERRFEAAEDEGALTAAVAQLVNSLRDPHCQFAPAGRETFLSAGFSLAPDVQQDEVGFYVSGIRDPALASVLAVGDRLVRYEDVPARELLEKHALQFSANHRRAQAWGIAAFLSSGRRASSSNTKDGDRHRWVFQRDGGGEEFVVERAWRPHSASRGNQSSDFRIQYDALSCRNLPARDYGPYELTTHGQNFCLYTGTTPDSAAMPVLRYFSFLYDADDGSDWHARADYFLLKRALAELKGAHGLVIDLRDNGGGRNPNWFLDWFAPRGYTGHRIAFRLHPELDSQDKLAAVGLGDIADSYLAQLARRRPGQELTEAVPFFCPPEGGCDSWSNRYVPEHRVTQLPIALLVGPRCVSSCDAVAQVFDEHELGPLIGEPTMAAFTPFRMRREVKTPAGKVLGHAFLAFSVLLSGKTDEPLEGRLPHIDAPLPLTRENLARYDAQLVEAARKALADWPVAGGK